MNRIKAVTLVLITGMVSGCAGFAPGSTREIMAEQSPVEVIAADFTRAMVQLPILEPTDTTVQFERRAQTRNGLLSALQESMLEAGYGIQSVPVLAGRYPVSHSEQREILAGRAVLSTHELAIGSIRFRRQYRIDRFGHVKPAGSLFVKGADASMLVMDDSSFDSDSYDLALPQDESISQQPGYTNPERESAKAVVAAAPAPQPLAPVSLTSSMRAPLIAQAPAQSRTQAGEPAGSLLPFTQNVFEIGQSNYDDLLDNFRNVNERILVFGNDSVHLGRQNKSVIQRMVTRFDQYRDVMSVIGCSQGPTKLANGNQALALGRANRVKEALVLAGVPQDRILDEGCWAGEASRKMPSRGVVITHLREAG